MGVLSIQGTTIVLLLFVLSALLFLMVLHNDHEGYSDQSIDHHSLFPDKDYLKGDSNNIVEGILPLSTTDRPRTTAAGKIRQIRSREGEQIRSRRSLSSSAPRALPAREREYHFSGKRVANTTTSSLLNSLKSLLSSRVSQLGDDSSGKEKDLRNFATLSRTVDHLRDEIGGWDPQTAQIRNASAVKDVLGEGMNNYHQTYAESKFLWQRKKLEEKIFGEFAPAPTSPLEIDLAHLPEMFDVIVLTGNESDNVLFLEDWKHILAPSAVSSPRSEREREQQQQQQQQQENEKAEERKMMMNMHVIIIQQGDPHRPVAIPDWLTYELYTKVDVIRAVGEKDAWIFDMDSDCDNFRGDGGWQAANFGFLVADRDFVFVINPYTKPPPPPPPLLNREKKREVREWGDGEREGGEAEEERIIKMESVSSIFQRHAYNLHTPSTPFYFNTLGDSFRESGDFPSGYPYSLRNGVQTAISLGIEHKFAEFDAATQIFKGNFLGTTPRKTTTAATAATTTSIRNRGRNNRILAENSVQKGPIRGIILEGVGEMAEKIQLQRSIDAPFFADIGVVKHKQEKEEKSGSKSQSIRERNTRRLEYLSMPSTTYGYATTGTSFSSSSSDLSHNKKQDYRLYSHRNSDRENVHAHPTHSPQVTTIPNRMMFSLSMQNLAFNRKLIGPAFFLLGAPSYHRLAAATTATAGAGGAGKVGEKEGEKREGGGKNMWSNVNSESYLHLSGWMIKVVCDHVGVGIKTFLSPYSGERGERERQQQQEQQQEQGLFERLKRDLYWFDQAEYAVRFFSSLALSKKRDSVSQAFDELLDAMQREATSAENTGAAENNVLLLHLIFKEIVQAARIYSALWERRNKFEIDSMLDLRASRSSYSPFNPPISPDSPLSFTPILPDSSTFRGNTGSNFGGSAAVVRQHPQFQSTKSHLSGQGGKGNRKYRAGGVGGAVGVGGGSLAGGSNKVGKGKGVNGVKGSKNIKGPKGGFGGNGVDDGRRHMLSEQDLVRRKQQQQQQQQQRRHDLVPLHKYKKQEQQQQQQQAVQKYVEVRPLYDDTNRNSSEKGEIWTKLRDLTDKGTHRGLTDGLGSTSSSSLPFPSPTANSKYVDQHKCAVFTITRNDTQMLAIFTRYYAQYFPARDIYVLNHHDGTPKSNLFPKNHENRPDMAKIFGGNKSDIRVIDLYGDTAGFPLYFFINHADLYQRRLLRWGYRCVLLVDVDEIILADTDRFPDGGLAQYLTEWVKDDARVYQRASGRALAHISEPDESAGRVNYDAVEPAIDWDTTPILQQRTYWGFSAKYNKPVLAKRPARHKAGFHNYFTPRDVQVDDSLVLLHLREFDKETCLAREERKAALAQKSHQSEIDKHYSTHLIHYESRMKKGETCQFAKGVYAEKFKGAYDNTGTIKLEKISLNWARISV